MSRWARRAWDALEPSRRPENLRRTGLIALVVGTTLGLINHADVVLAGDATPLTAVKAALNYIVPFVVSNLGLLVGARERAADRGTS